MVLSPGAFESQKNCLIGTASMTPEQQSSHSAKAPHKNWGHPEIDSKEKSRLNIINAVMSRRIMVQDASRALRLSVRQVYRLMARVKINGDAGVVHGNRGKVPWNKPARETINTVINVASRFSHNYKVEELQNILANDYGIRMHRQTIRRHLKRAAAAAAAHPIKELALCGDPSQNFTRWVEPDSCLDVSDRGAVITLQDKTLLSLFVAIERRTRCIRAWIYEVNGSRVITESPQVFICPSGPIAALRIHGARLYEQGAFIALSNREADLKNLFGGAMNHLGQKTCGRCFAQLECKVEADFVAFEKKFTKELKIAATQTMYETRRVLDHSLRQHNRYCEK